MAVIVDDADAAPATEEAPKRRRVRRKVSASATEASAAGPISVVEPNEIEPDGEPALLDVTPVEAAEPAPVVKPRREPRPAPIAAPAPTPEPEIDVAALIAEDPNQIVAPPEKPKRGWWRR
jgi:ribonuclease E